MNFFSDTFTAWRNIGNVAGSLDAINQTLQEMKQEMANDRQALDDALTSIGQGITDLGTKLQALTDAINNLPQPGSEDFTPEIQAVTNAAAAVAAQQQQVQDDLNKLNPPPP